VYEGTITYSINGMVEDRTTYTRRIITSDSIVKWCDKPDTTAQIVSGRYNMSLVFKSTSCGDQVSVYDYTTITAITDSTVTESGTITYRFYYNGELRKTLHGTFTAECKITHI